MKYFLNFSKTMRVLFLFLVFTGTGYATNIYYSVGISTADLKTGSPTITISNGTATFSVAQPDNIGVGDKITYNTSSVAYISGRTSSTVYSVITATGGTPSNVSGVTVNSIKRTFNSLNSAFAGAYGASYLNTGNLVTNTYVLNFPCYADGNDNTAIEIANKYTTNRTYYIRAYTPVSSSEVGTSQRHKGKWSTTDGYYISLNKSDRVIKFYEEYIHFDGLQVENTNTDAGKAFRGYSASDGIEISNCIVKGNGTGSALSFYSSTGDTVKVWNNVIYGSWGTGVDCGSTDDGTPKYFVYNNTFYGCSSEAVNALGSGAVVYLKNNVAVNSGGYVVEDGTYDASSTNNATSSGTNQGSNPITLSGSTATDYFVSATDFHISNSATNASELIGKGADLSSDVVIPLTKDIDGGIRSATTPDIGADEEGAGGSGAITSVSVVHTSTNINDISNITIKFTPETAIPANGDIEVTFDSDFDISGATYVSGTAVTVVSATNNVLILNSTSAINASSPVSIVISGIKNPSSDQTCDEYVIETQDASDVILDKGAATGNTFSVGSLTGVSVTHASLNTSDISNTTINFTPETAVPVNGDIEVAFDSDFDISGATYVSGTAVTVVSATNNVLVLNSTSSINASSPVSIVISGIKNPSSAQTCDAYAIETQDASDGKLNVGTSSGNTFVVAPDTTAPSVSVTVPNGGEEWNAEGTYNITWSVTDNDSVAQCLLFYSIDNGSNWVFIAKTLGNTASYSWVIPSAAVDDSAKIKIVASDPSSNTKSDESNATFAILPKDTTKPVVNITQPQGGTLVDIATNLDINWNVTDGRSVQKCSLYYSFDNEASWVFMAETVFTETATFTGTYSWAVPDTIITSNRCKIKAEAFDASGNKGTAVSGGFNLIDKVAPVVSVVSPNGGEGWAAGSQKTISWTASDNIKLKSCILFYSYDNSTWEKIDSIAGVNKSYDWTLPDESANTCWVKVVVYDESGNSASDTSNSYFGISSKPYLTSKDTIKVELGGSIYYVPTYDKGGCVGNERLELLYNPSWISNIPTPIVGKAPSEECSDSVKIRITVGDVSTIEVIHIIVFNPVSIIPIKANIINFGLRCVKSNNGVRFLVGMEKSGSFNLTLFDVRGRKLFDTNRTAKSSGIYEISYKSFGSGTYIAVLKAGSKIINQRITFIE